MGERKLFSYEEENMQQALQAVREGKLAVSTAARQFRIPRTSLRNRLSGRTADACRQVGPSCVLGNETENKLMNWILDMAQRGFPVNKDGLIYSVKRIIEDCNIEAKCIKNKTPGRKWFDGFLKRHPEVRQKKAEFLSKARALVTETSIRNWFAQTRFLLENDLEVLDHPDRIFNMDETAIFLSPKGSLILGPKGKGVYDVGASEKDNVTTLITVSAEGEIISPMTIFKFQRLPKSYPSSAPSGWGVGISDTGWMQSKQFYEYFANIFIKHLDLNKIPRPVVVFMDGHGSHLSLSLSTLCRMNGIILICLPPNTTHMLQPLDVAFFYPLKQAWKKVTRKWRLEHDGMSIQKKDVPSALNTLLRTENFQKSVVSGFRSCGLYPFDENAPDYSKCIKKSFEEIQPNSEPKESDSDAEILRCIEQKIEPSVLKQFLTTNTSQSVWSGEEKYLELFKLWKTFKHTNSEVDGKVFSDLEINLDNDNENLMIFDFPEFENRQDTPSLDVNILEDITLTPERLLSESGENMFEELTSKCEEEKEINVLQTGHRLAEENAEFEDDKEIRFLKKKTVSEVLSDINVWPNINDKTEGGKEKKKQSKLKLPSVITSDKWVELMEAKENAKNVPKRKRNVKEIDRNIKKPRTNETEKTDTDEPETKTDKSKSKTDQLRIGDKGSKNKNKSDHSETSRSINSGSYVIIKYNKELYPAKVVNIQNDEYFCCAMTKSGRDHWKWPEKNDLLWYRIDDIIMVIEEPQVFNMRGAYTVPEMKQLDEFVSN